MIVDVTMYCTRTCLGNFIAVAYYYSLQVIGNIITDYTVLAYCTLLVLLKLHSTVAQV